MTRDNDVDAIMDMLKPDPWGQATVPETGGTPWPEPHGHAPGFLASCSECIKGTPYGDYPEDY